MTEKVKNSSLFHKAWNQLNPEQKKAVETVYGPVLVVAGPGTGKTQLLTTRIAHILRTLDTRAENILCLTFTENGAAQMRNRLEKWLGIDAYKVSICTFHGFCEFVLKEYPDFFPESVRTFRVADDLDKAEIFRAIIDQKHWEYLKPFAGKYYYQGNFLSKMSQLKREHITPETLAQRLPQEKEARFSDPKNFYKRDCKYGKKGDMKAGIEEKIEAQIAKMYEFCEAWKSYEAEKKSRLLYDFDDQIVWVLEKIRTDQTLKSELQEQFHFILVDEYQDTNAAQNEILWLLGDFDDQPNLFAVGDDDQSIFRFQGANLENLLAFENRLTNAQRVTLTQNYRSTQNILDAAYHSVGHNLERLDSEKSLQSNRDKKSKNIPIYQAVLSSRSAEVVFLIQQISSLIKAGTPPEEIAILVRENREITYIAQMISMLGDFRISAPVTENIWEDDLVGQLIKMLKVYQNPLLDHDFFEMLHAPFWELPSIDLWNLSVQARTEKIPFSLVLQKSTKAQPKLNKIVELFADLRKNYLQTSPLVIAQKIWHLSGMASWVCGESNPDRILEVQKIKKFFDWLEFSVQERGLKNLNQILDRIELHRTLGIPTFPDILASDRKAVQIMTIHKSKGLEFAAVFLPGLLDKVWGNKRVSDSLPLPQFSQSSHDPNEEERRLFFVGLTRAKSQLFLSYSEIDMAGRERVPSQFWHEIPEELIQSVDTENAENKSKDLLPVFMGTENAPILTHNEKSMLEGLVKKFVWSATSLQTYLECPQKFLFLHLIKIPTPPKPIFAYGAAMHFALENFIKQSREKNLEYPDLEGFFVENLQTQNLTKIEKEEAILQGKKILKNYFESNRENLKFAKNWIVEVSLNSEIDRIPIYGKIDKIEVSEDGKNAVLVDYKSGKPQSITPGSRLWRQMVFYDLLATGARGYSWKHEGCALEFLAPDPQGKLSKKPVIITQEDRMAVKAEIIECHQKLLNLEFPLVENPVQDPEISYWQRLGRTFS